MTDLPSWVEARFARQAKLQAALEGVLAKHLPQPREGQPSNEDEAFKLLCGNLSLSPAGGYYVLNKVAEHERLAQFRRALEAAAVAWAALSPDTRHELSQGAQGLDPGSVRGFWSGGRLPPLDIVAALPAMMRAGQRRAACEIDRSADAGAIGWRAVSIVSDCRDLWTRRTERPAPHSTKPATRFHDFIEAVLDAFGAGRPIPAMRRWKRLHSEGKIRR